MAQQGKQTNILWIALIGGAIYYFWNAKKKRDAEIRALAQRQGGQEVGGSGGGGGGFGGGGITPLTPVITGQGSNGEDINVNVDVETSDPTPPSAVDCIKFPNTAGCENYQAPQQVVDDKFQQPTQGANPSGQYNPPTGGGTATPPSGGGGTTGGTTPQGGGATGGSVGTTTQAPMPKMTANVSTANFRGSLNMGQKKAWDFDGDFDYMDRGNGRAKTDFDGEL